ncbi:MAG TPA: DUF883 C-terminal domain-containing protein, partial [Polyangiaceae bacterium]|nr:DUF883 C-terminal domain-containing protein [Polyangiaceae bacterium]
PETVQRAVKENPYRALGIAAGVGFGAGTILGSRLLRAMMLTAGGVLASELARDRVRKWVEALADEADNASNGAQEPDRKSEQT